MAFSRSPVYSRSQERKPAVFHGCAPALQLGKNVRLTIFAICPLVALALGRL
jgi:hypothetical protein